MGVKITSLELENVKRVKAVALEPVESGLTIIGGRNGQGKTSVLDAIAWALGGDRYRPGAAQRDGSVLPPSLKVTLSNGLTVERKGPQGKLVVTDETGKRHGQKLLDAFTEALALNLPKFLTASDREKAETLLNIIGVKDELDRLTLKEQGLYDTRTQVGRDRDRQRHLADGMEVYDEDLPNEPISVADLAQQYREANFLNTQNRLARERAAALNQKYKELKAQVMELQKAMEDTLEQMDAANRQIVEDVDLSELASQIDSAEEINRKINANAAFRKAAADADRLEKDYIDLTSQIELVRLERKKLLDGADLPLPGLGVEDGVLTMHGKPWDCMSGSEQLRAATAIVSRLKPECRFVLVDKLEQLDAETLREFSAWAAENDMQVIGTRVSTGSECSIIIEDGTAVKPEPPKAKWKAGEF